MSVSLRVFKYPLEIVEHQTIQVPDAFKALSVETQGETVVLYAIVNPDEPLRSRIIYVVGTGQPIEINASFNFVGTVKLYGGRIMFHIFDGGWET